MNTMKKQPWQLVAIALSILALALGQPAIAQSTSTALNVQAITAPEDAAVGNTQPAKLLVLITDAKTGMSIKGLRESNTAITNHSAPPGSKCGFSGQVRDFRDIGTGAYQIQLGLGSSIPGCDWVKGTYLGQISVSDRGKQGQAPFSLTIP